MTQLTIGYSDSEDRLWLLLSDESFQFWLSRRFCDVLLRHLEQSLTESCPGGQLHGSLDAQTRVALEHQAAQESEMVAPVVEQTVVATARQSALLTSVVLTVDSAKVLLELVTPGYARCLHFSRAEAHQLLALIWQHCRQAEWGLTEPGW